MKKWIYTALAVLALYQIYLRNPQLGEHVQDFLPVASESRFQGVSEEVSGEQQLADAFNRQLSDVQVSGSGQVIKVLADDTREAGIRSSFLNSLLGKRYWLRIISI